MSRKRENLMIKKKEKSKKEKERKKKERKKEMQ